ncbi:MAG: helix-hairpin-helix domain-containing protein [Deltaproteobacteria bacterium]|nr:helix-hairpin-helix domain-containing protein [Deltaproteobacteria bacterium]
MSEHARRTVALLVLVAAAGLGWRAATDPARPATAPPPCHRPVAVAGEARGTGVVCLGPTATAVDALRAAGARCLPASLPSAVAPGDRLTVVRSDTRGGAGDRPGGQPACRVERDRLPALALRTLRVPIDPNRADEAELRALPGIGPALAKRIVESRRAQGPFATVEELRRVRGIGPRTLDRLRGRLEVRP